jgi:hypothetical protein
MIHRLRRDQVRHRRRCRTDEEYTRPRFSPKICECHAFMMAQVLNPGFDEKHFNVAAWIRGIAEEIPTHRAIQATPQRV